MINFCMLIMHSVNLLNLLFSCRRFFFPDPLDFHVDNDVIRKTGQFYSFSCLSALPRTYNIMLNRNDESEHACFILDFRDKAFILSSLTVMLSIGFMCFLLWLFVESFYHE